MFAISKNISIAIRHYIRIRLYSVMGYQTLLDSSVSTFPHSHVILHTSYLRRASRLDNLPGPLIVASQDWPGRAVRLDQVHFHFGAHNLIL